MKAARGLVITASILLIALYFLFVFDIGINSANFVRADFENAFNARMTGNCELFKSYMVQNHDEWGERCIEEKDRDGAPIENFEILQLTTSGGRAFVQARLKRDVSELNLISLNLSRDEIELLDKGYVATYDMERFHNDKFLGFLPATKWRIKNEVR